MPRSIFYIIVLSFLSLTASQGRTQGTHFFFDPTSDGNISRAIQNAISTGHKNIQLPCGVFEVERTIELPKDSSLIGSGHCTVLKMSSKIQPSRVYADSFPEAKSHLRAIITNQKIGDTDIVVRSLTLDGSDSPGNTHLVSFYRVSRVVAEEIRFIGSETAAVQDGISMVSSSNYTIKNNYCEKIYNACYDQWNGSMDFKILDNSIDGGGILRYGILVNGISGNNTPDTTSNFTITGNTIHNVTDLGIGVYGLCTSDKLVCGRVADGIILGNRIEGVSRYHGVWVGNATGVRVDRNIILDVTGDAIRIAAQDKGGITNDILVVDNYIERSDRKGGSAIVVGSGTDRPREVQVRGNNVRGYTARVRIAPGASVKEDGD